MQALNFLKQQPLVSWIDFVCDQAKLWQHLASGKNDPTPEALILQLCSQASVEEKESRNSDTLPEDIDYCVTKAKSLRILALKILAFKKWDLRCIVGQLPMALQKQLLDELLIQAGITTLGGNFFKSSEGETPMPWQAFAAVLFSRWSLSSVIQQKRPKPPAKPTVSNPLLQPDANLAARDADLLVVAEIEGLREAAVEVLESFCDRSDKFVFCIPVPECFNMPNSTDSAVPIHSWEEAYAPADCSEAACQVHYDLGAHYFYSKKYVRSRTHFKAVGKLWFRQPDDHRSGYHDIDVPALTGYCEALKIGSVGRKLKKISVKSSGGENPVKKLMSCEKDDDVVEVLVRDNCHRQLSLACRTLLSSKSEKIGQNPSVKCSQWLRCWTDGNLALRQSTYRLSNRDGKFLLHFGQCLAQVLKNSGANEKRVLACIWQFLLATVPDFVGNDTALDGLTDVLGSSIKLSQIELQQPDNFSLSVPSPLSIVVLILCQNESQMIPL